ncbi:hypothetical protein DRQ36_03700 [bacterium]|nr:MAG: hypothetical protein DRQ36_03700 [bacterium]
MKKFIIMTVVLAVIAVLVLIGLKLGTRAGGAVAVQVESVERRDISQVVTAFGRLSPQVEVNISSKVIGQIERLFVDEGDTVQKGDTLAELEKTRYLAALSSAEAALRSARSQVAQVEANLSQARENLRKSEKMFEKKLISEDALKEIRTQVEILEAQHASAKDGIERAKATLEETRDDLNRTTITAPVSGVVINVEAQEGENVIMGTMNNPGSVIMTIAQLDAMEAVVDVDEADVVDLAIGQQARIEIDAFTDTFMVGRVSKIANQAKIQNIGGQETVAYFEIRIAVDEPLEGIRPGMSCSAEIEVDKADNVLSVPIQAVVAAREKEKPPEEEKERPGGVKVTIGGPPRGGEKKPRNDFRKIKEAVFVVENGVAKQRVVTSGIADDRYIEIKEGIEEGDTIVIGHYKALRNLKDGDKVRVLGESRQPGRRFDVEPD